MSAHREGLFVRDIAQHVGLSPTRVHQLVTSPQADCVEHALSVLRVVGWPAPDDPNPDAEELLADRLIDEAAALVSCAKWLESLSTGGTPVVNLRPEEQAPDTYYVAVDQSRIIRVLRRIAHDLEELARARRVQDLSTSANDTDPCLRLCRRLAEPPIQLSVGVMSIQQSRQAWEDYANDLKRTGLPVPPNPYRHLDCSVK